MTNGELSHEGPDQLYPFQRGLVYDLLDPEFRRTIVVWPPGSGVVTSLVETCKEWLNREHEARILVLTEGSLLRDQWLSRLSNAGLPFVSIAVSDYRRLEVDTSAEINPWSSIVCAVTTIDVVRESRRLESTLQAQWDVVIIDGCHRPGSGTRGALAIDRLWNQSTIKFVIATTITPHTLLTFPPHERLTDSCRVLTFQAGEMLEHLAPKVSAKVIKLTPAEHKLIKTTHTLDMFAGEEKLVSYVRSELVRRASSSIITLDTSLHSLIARSELRNEAAYEEFEDFAPDEELSDLPAPLQEGLFDIEHLQGLVDLINEVEIDSKADALATLLASELSSGLVVVFSDFADTVTYLVEHLQGSGLSPFALTRQSMQEEIIEATRAIESGVGVVIASTSAVQGMDLGAASVTIHYDLPRTAQGMELRMSRVNRVGRIVGPSIALVDEVSFDSEFLMSLGVTVLDELDRH